MADNQPDNIETDIESLEKEENFSKISILDLQKKYGIQRDSFYGRTRYLQIKTWKEGGKAYLDADQTAEMDGLHNHIKTAGRMEGYPVPDPSGPVEEDEQPTSTSLAVTETQQITVTPTYTPKQKRSQSSQQVDDTAAIIQSAQNKAAGTLIAENLLARHFIENPDSLPDNLKEKIKESGQIPSVDPFAYANSLINLANVSGLAA